MVRPVEVASENVIGRNVDQANVSALAGDGKNCRSNGIGPKRGVGFALATINGSKSSTINHDAWSHGVQGIID
jgi:hypothetical protein